MPDVQVRFSDGLSEKGIATTDTGGAAIVDHVFLWCHRRGDKAPPPPQFTLLLERAGEKAEQNGR